jgi:hypothetical protein
MRYVWTEQDLAELRARTRSPSDITHPPFKMPANDVGAFALGRLPVGTMNKTEVAYDTYLWNQRHAGAILWHKFEPIKLRLADNTFYTPDFGVLPASNVLELHEIKGFMMEDANVKIKVAAVTFPFIFKLVRRCPKKNGGGWFVEEISR